MKTHRNWIFYLNENSVILPSSAKQMQVNDIESVFGFFWQQFLLFHFIYFFRNNARRCHTMPYHAMRTNSFYVWMPQSAYIRIVLVILVFLAASWFIACERELHDKCFPTEKKKSNSRNKNKIRKCRWTCERLHHTRNPDWELDTLRIIHLA